MISELEWWEGAGGNDWSVLRVSCVGKDMDSAGMSGISGNVWWQQLEELSPPPACRDGVSPGQPNLVFLLKGSPEGKRTSWDAQGQHWKISRLELQNSGPCLLE